MFAYQDGLLGLIILRINPPKGLVLNVYRVE